MRNAPSVLTVVRRAVWVAVWAAAILPAQATELSDVVQAALNRDATLAVAKAEHAVARTKHDQADALWRPQIMLGTTVGVANSQSSMTGAQFSAPGMGTSSGVDFATSVNGGPMARVTLGMVKPLYHPALTASQAQLKAGAQLGDLGEQQARRNLVVSTTQRYWGLALAQERVGLLERQIDTLNKQWVESQDRFKLGASPITDTHEAKALLEQAQAQLTAAQLDVKTRQQALVDSTGLPSVQAQWPAGSVVSLDRWAVAPAASLELALERARQSNGLVLMQQQALAIAQQELAKVQAQSGLRVDWVAEAAYERVKGSGDFGQASNKATRAMVGVQGNWVLSSGGMLEAKALEAEKNVALEQAKLSQVVQSVEQQVRQTWWAIEAEPVRLKALQAALAASQARLDATRLGREVGDRTHVDVLNATLEVSSLQIKVLESRVDQVMHALQLGGLMAQVP